LKAYEAAAQNISKYDVLLVEDMSAEAYSKLLLRFGLESLRVDGLVVTILEGLRQDSYPHDMLLTKAITRRQSDILKNA